MTLKCLWEGKEKNLRTKEVTVSAFGSGLQDLAIAYVGKFIDYVFPNTSNFTGKDLCCHYLPVTFIILLLSIGQ